MRLKSLELQGFKSFPDKTTLEFTGGVTAVLGPNGSGKSNISDAVRWVLGELSSKNIRGTKMEDVIFGGSDTRRPMGYAEVTMTIDNAFGDTRLASEYDEVAVTRRFFRSGNSEYLINRKPVRLRDINELFMNTGLGKSGYSIIGQGKIAEIISQKSEDRRKIFEEAAGISKYRFQKTDAERKLAEVDDNAIRLNDILTELSKRVRQLERDAEKAKIYLSVYEDKKRADVSLWLYETADLKKRFEETERKFAASKLSLEEADRESEDLERRSEALYEELLSDRAEEEKAAEKLRAVTDKRRAAENRGTILGRDIEHYAELIGAAEADIARLTADIEKAEDDGKHFAGVMEEQKTAISEKEKEAAANRENAAELEKALADAEERAIQNEDRLAEVRDSLSEARMALSELEGSHKTDVTRGTDLSDEKEKLVSQSEMLLSRMKKADGAIASYQSRIDEQEAAIADIRTRLTETEETIAVKREKAAELTVTLSTKRQRADTLRRMDEHFEGYQQSVRFVMNEASFGRIRSICGPISKLIRVDPRHSVAVETALGANMQNIVVEDETAAKAAIASLKQNNAGRCTFFPISSIRAQSLPVSRSALESKRGFIGAADELCGCDDKYREIISNLLGRTAVFDTLDHASETAKALGYKVRIVTLDGQLINAGGSFTGGSVKRDSGMLTRAAEIEKLTEEAKKIEESLAAVQEEQKNLLDSMPQMKDEIGDADAQISLFRTMLQAESTQLEVLRAQKEANDARLGELDASIGTLDAERTRYSEEHDRLDGKIRSGEAEEEALLADAEALSGEMHEKNTEILDTNRAYNELQLAITVLRKDLEAAELAVENARLSAENAKAQKEAKENDRAGLLSRKALAEASVTETKTDAEALTKELSEAEAALRGYTDRGAELERKQNQIREQQKEKTRERELLFRETTTLESNTEQLRGDIDRATARLWDDYELTFTTADALGYPPVTKETRAEVTAQRDALRIQLKKLGSVNANAIEEYRTEKERFDFTDAQFKDLTKAREELTGIISRLDSEMKTKFADAVRDINRNFQIIFRELFDGGNAEIRLSEPDNVLESGIEINAAPPGKVIKSMSLLSGGEQSYTAIALIFAILNVNPTPFCIFDEIEAALDEVNVARFAAYMRRYSEKTQFLVITHRRGTMESADMIYGVTMPERGISRVIGMNVNEVEQKIGVTLK